jgi:murein hydrolase activator
MDIKQVKGVGPAKAEKLRAAGIATVHDLARCEPAQVAEASGLKEADVRELRQRAAAHAILEDMKGFGPGTLAALSERSAESLRELYHASADWLAAQAEVAAARLQEARQQAEQVARHVAESARTPEGRKGLAREAEEAGRKAVAATRKAAEAAAERAKELRGRAPGLVARAQEGVKEAEARLKEASRRTQAAIKAEAEKARARTERVVSQARSRMDRTQP